MSGSRDFTAPWALSLRLTTILASALLLGVAAIGFYLAIEEPWYVPTLVAGPSLVILVASSFFRVLGYRVEPGRLVVRRPGWNTLVSLEGLREVRHEPGAMARALRLMGNGGLFVFAGRFRNSTLGNFQAWATDPAAATVLRFDDRTVVVTPDRARRFVEAIEEAAGIGSDA